jgi:hypothetical protein
MDGMTVLVLVFPALALLAGVYWLLWVIYHGSRVVRERDAVKTWPRLNTDYPELRKLVDWEKEYKAGLRKRCRVAWIPVALVVVGAIVIDIPMAVMLLVLALAAWLWVTVEMFCVHYGTVQLRDDLENKIDEAVARAQHGATGQVSEPVPG